MIEIDIERLRSLGLTPARAADAAAFTDSLEETGRLMRLVEIHRETVLLHDGMRVLKARLPTRFVREIEAQDIGMAVGDWVVAAVDRHGDGWVVTRVPPHTHIARRDADGRRHAVVSNVDTALLVMGLDDDFNPRRLERYFALLHGSGMQAVVLLSKADAVGADRAAHAREALHGRVPAGVEVLAVDARSAEAAHALSPWLGAGQTLVVLGSSGAGKSTLTNTLLGRAEQDTGAVREHDSRGKHTTTARSLHRLSGGACLIDTPGLRALRPNADETGIAASFADIEALATRCRFRDCRHGEEPGCAVRAGVPADRLRNFHKLLREARRDSLTVLQRREQLALWKARGRAGQARLKAKRGEG